MLLLKVMDKKIHFLIVGLQKTIYDQFSKRTHQDSNPVELIVLQKWFVWGINLAVDYFVFTTGSFTIFSFRSILTVRCILWITQLRKWKSVFSNAISFHFFLRLRLCFDILPRIALRGIGAERCVKWKSMGLELTLIDWLEKMLFYLHSLLCCSWMKAQQSSNGLLRLSFSPIPTTTYESHLKTAQKFRRRATINQKVSQIATLKLGGAEVKAVSLLPNC